MRVYYTDLSERRVCQPALDSFARFDWPIIKVPCVLPDENQMPHMTAGEVACFKTHLQILESIDEPSIIVEDDTCAVTPWNVLVDLLSQLPKDWKLAHLYPRRSFVQERLPGPFRWVPYTGFHVIGAGAYAITPEHAQTVLAAASTKQHHPIDTFYDSLNDGYHYASVSLIRAMPRSYSLLEPDRRRRKNARTRH